MTLYHHCQDCPPGCKRSGGIHTVACTYCLAHGGVGAEPIEGTER